MRCRLGALALLFLLGLTCAVQEGNLRPAHSTPVSAKVASFEPAAGPSSDAFIRPHTNISVIVEHAHERQTLPEAEKADPEKAIDNRTVNNPPVADRAAGVRRAILRVYRI